MNIKYCARSYLSVISPKISGRQKGLTNGIKEGHMTSTPILRTQSRHIQRAQS